MAINKEQVKELLGSGLGPEVVASAVGCDVSYISQLLSDEAFASEVATLRTVALTANSKRDLSLNAIEDKLITKLSEAVEENAFYKPKDLLHAVAVINRAVRRGAPVSHAGAVVNTVIQLQLPAPVIQRFITSRTNEVIEVDGNTMVTMPAHQLLRNLAARGEGTDGQRYKESLKYLPSGITTTVRDESGGAGEI